MNPHKLTSTLLTILAFVATSHSLGQVANSIAGTLSKPESQTEIPGLSHTWTRLWDKGYLITWGSVSGQDASPTEPAVTLYDREGHVAREGIVWFKDASSVGINDVAVSGTGNLVVAGGTESRTGAIANFIATIGRDGHVDSVIRTNPFLPIYVCAAEDGTVWSYGIDRDAGGRGVASSLRLRQYSFNKGQIKSMLDVSTLNSAGWKLSRGRYPGEISLRCNAEKLGIYNAASGEWVELAFSTNKLKVAKVNPLPSPKQLRLRGFAMTDSGDVFASLADKSTTPARVGLFRLEFEGNGPGSWVPVGNTVGPYLHAPIDMLLGADGDKLVYTRDLSGNAYWSTFRKRP
jgi:hypothetical protein